MPTDACDRSLIYGEAHDYDIIIGRPTVSITPAGPLTLCVGETQTLTASGANTYSWAPATDLSATNVAAPVLTAATTGTRTYTVTGTAANGCTNSATITVTVNPNPTVSITPAGPLTLCVGETQTLTASGANTYSWAPATDLSATNVAAPVLTAATTGTRTYTVTGTAANGCTNSATITVTVNANPTVTITPAGPLTLCVGETQTLTASGANTYSWAPATDLSATNVAAPVLTAATTGTRTYTVTGTAANGCTNSATITVTVNANPTVTITPAGPLTLCVGETQTLTASGANTYSWAPATDLSATNVAAPVLTAATTGTRTYTVTGSTPSGCTNSATITVTVNPNPTVSITPAGPSTLCVGQTQALTASGASSYTWAPATDLSATNVAAPVLTAATTGTRTYTVTGTAANGCTNSATITVTVNANPTVTITPAGPLTLCVGETQTLTASGANTYSWAPATDLSATNVAAPVLTALTTGTRTYTVIGTAANGCTNSATITVTVSTTITVSIVPTGPLTLCVGQIQTLTASGATSYTWAPATDLSATNVAAPVLTAATTGTRTYTVTGSTPSGCTNSTTITVTVNPNPTVSITPPGPLTFCVGHMMTLTASGANTYLWTPATDLSAKNVAAPTLMATTPGTRTYTVIGTTTATGCTNSASITVTVNPNPTVSITPPGPLTLCVGQTQTLTASGANSYFWSPATDLSATNVAAPVLTASTTGTRTYTVVGFTAAGCTGSATVTVTVNPNPTVSITPTGPLTLCIGQTQTLTASGANTYTWSPATDLSATNVAAPVLTASTTGTRTYTVVGFTAAGCTGSATVTVTVNPNPTVSITPPGPLTLCVGQTQTLTASGANSYFWSPATDLSATNVAAPVLTASTTGTRTYTVVGFTAAGCTGSATVTVTVNPNPTVSITPTGPLTLCIGQTQTLTASGANTYTWSPATDLSATNVAAPVLTASTTGTRTYTVTGTAANGCTNSATITVTVNPNPTVSITPAGPLTLCVGETQTLTASGANTYSWAPATDLSATNVAAPVLTASTTGTRTYTVVGSTASGCTNSTTVTVTVNSNPTVSITPTGPLTLCVGQTQTLTASGASTYTWSPATDLSATNVAAPVLTASTIGTRTYTVVGSTASGCTNSSTVTVTVSTGPSLSITPPGPLTLCVGQTQTLTASGASIYTWSPGTDLSATNVAAPVLTAITLGSRTYTVTAANAIGCTNSAVVAVSVIASPILTINPVGPIVVCQNQSLTLNASGASTYSWTPPTSLSNPTISNPTVSTSTPFTSRVYTVTGTDNNGCTNSATVTVTVNPLPVVSAVANPTAICQGGSTTLGAGGAVTYTWNPGNLIGVQNPVVTPASTTTYTVTGTDNNGCTNTASVTITVNPPPVAPALPVVTICAGTSATLTNPVTGLTSRWYAVPVGGSALGTGPNFTTPVLGSAGTYTYYLEVQDGNGCVSAVRRPVDVVVVDPIAPLSPIVGPTEVCTGTISTLSVISIPNVTFNWSGLPMGAAIESGQGTHQLVVNWSIARAGVYTITVTPVYLCGPGSSQSVQITVREVPKRPDNIFGQQQVCVGTTTSYTVSTRPDETYAWSISPAGPNNLIAVGGTATVTWLTPGTYVLLVRASNVCGTSNFTSLLVTVTAPVIPNPGPARTTCNSLAILNAGNPAPGTGTWKFLSGPVNASVTTSGTRGLVSGLTADGVYEFGWEVQNGGCPPQMATVQVTRLSTPTQPAITTPQIFVCEQSVGQFSFQPPAVGTGVWSFISGPVQAAIDQNGFVTGATQPGTYRFRYTVTTPCGSSFAESELIRENRPGQPFAGADQFVCENPFALVFGSPIPPGYIGEWVFVNGPVQAKVTTFGRYGSVVNMHAPGIYSFAWTIRSERGICEPASDIVRITRSHEPTPANVTGPTAICGTVATLVGNIPVHGTASWSFISGPMMPVLDPRSETLTISGMTAPGRYTFRWTISNPPCVPEAFDHTIDVAPGFSAGTLTGATTVCAGDNQGFVTLSGFTGELTRWEIADNPAFANPTIPINTTPTQGYTNLTQTTWFRARVEQGICPPQYSNPVAVTVVPSNISVNLGPDQTICTTTALIQATTNPANLPVTWTLVSQPTGGNALLTASGMTAGLSNLAAGTTIVRADVDNGCGTASDVILITSFGELSGGVLSSSRTVCAGSNSGLLTLTGSNGPILRWERSTDDWLTVQPIANTTAQLGYTNLTQTTRFRAVIGGGSCPTVQSSEVVITVAPALTANAGPDQTVCGSSFSLVGNNVPNATQTWTQVSGPVQLAFTVSGNLLIANNVTVPGVYTFQYRVSNGGCPDAIDYVDVTVGEGTAAGTVIGSTTVCQGSGTGSVQLVNYTGSIVRWETSTNNWVTFTTHNITVPVFNYFTLTQTTQFRAVVAVPGCPPQPTTHATVLVVPPPSTAQAPAVINTCRNQIFLQGVAPAVGTPSWSFVFGPATPVLTGAGSSAFVTGLTAAGTYLFEYRVENAPCAPSITYTQVVVGTTINAPSVLQLQQVTATSATVAWSAVASAAGYIVEVSDQTTAFSVWQPQAVCAPQTSATLTGLVPGRGYRVRVRSNCSSCAVNQPGDVVSVPSTAVNFVTPASRAAVMAAGGEQAAVVVYPNPNRGSFSVRVDAARETEVALTLTDAAGRRIWSGREVVAAGGQVLAVELERPASGLYLLEVLYSGRREVIKVIVE